MGKTRSVSLAFFSFRFLFACTEKLHEMKESCDFYCLNFFILVFKKSALLSILVRSFSNSGTFALIYLFIYFFHYACVWLLRKTRGNRDFWVFSNALLLFWCATPARVSFWIDSLWVARSFFFFWFLFHYAFLSCCWGKCEEIIGFIFCLPWFPRHCWFCRKSKLLNRFSLSVKETCAYICSSCVSISFLWENKEKRVYILCFVLF